MTKENEVDNSLRMHAINYGLGLRISGAYERPDLRKMPEDTDGMLRVADALTRNPEYIAQEAAFYESPTPGAARTLLGTVVKTVNALGVSLSVDDQKILTDVMKSSYDSCKGLRGGFQRYPVGDPTLGDLPAPTFGTPPGFSDVGRGG